VTGLSFETKLMRISNLGLIEAIAIKCIYLRYHPNPETRTVFSAESWMRIICNSVCVYTM